LATEGRIRRESVVKQGKRRKIYNFPVGPTEVDELRDRVSTGTPGWKKRLALLQVATGRSETELMEEALTDLAKKILAKEEPE
jgi:hypothetical protein